MRSAIVSGTVSVEKVYPLRLMVLRPGGILADCIFEGDEDPKTVHVVASEMSGLIRSVGSYYENGHPAIQANRPVQLRGMATHPDARGKGFGAEVLAYGMMHFFGHGADVIWCNAREVAVPFYEKHGFQKIGEPFEIGNIGKHWVMFHKR